MSDNQTIELLKKNLQFDRQNMSQSEFKMLKFSSKRSLSFYRGIESSRREKVGRFTC